MQKTRLTIVIFGVLIVALINSFVWGGAFTDWQQYLGGLLIATTLLLYFYQKKQYFYVGSLTLLLGTIRWVYFAYGFGTASRKVEFGAGVGGSSGTIDGITALLFIIFLIIHSDRIFPPSTETSDSPKEPNATYVENYKTKFLDKTEVELAEIAAPDSTYILEARLAAQQLLAEKDASTES